MSYIEDGGGRERPSAARVIDGELAIGTPVAEDGSLQSLIVTDAVHQRIHRGELFSGGFFDAVVGAGATMNILLQTGAIAPHLQLSGQAGQLVRAELYEDTTFSAAGSAITSINRNRNSAKTAGMVLTSAPTITLVGTALFAGFIPGGTGPQSEGGVLATFAEFLLKPNAVYLARLVNNLTTGTTPVEFDANWYEPGAA